MRKFVAILEIILLSAAAIWLVTQPGLVTVDWGEYHLEADLSISYLILLVAFIGLALIFKTWRFIILLPSRMYAYSQKLKPEKGLVALSQSVIASALGEHEQARNDAHRFERCLGDNPIYKTLLAYNHMQENHMSDARLICESMKNDANARTLSWILEAKMALKEGQETAASISLQNLYSLHEKSPWVVRELLKNSLGLKNYELALNILKKAERQKTLPLAKVKHIQGYVYFQQAAEEGLLVEQRENLLEGAHRLLPENVTICVQYAKLLFAMDKTKRAKKVIEQTWILNPHRDLLDAYVMIEPEAEKKAMMNAANKLVDCNPSHSMSYLAIADFALKQQEWARARAALHDYQEKHVMNAHACHLMAHLELGQHMDHAKYREWMERAFQATKTCAEDISLAYISRDLNA